MALNPLIINKNLLRNNYNEVIDINKVIIKNKRSKRKSDNDL